MYRKIKKTKTIPAMKCKKKMRSAKKIDSPVTIVVIIYRLPLARAFKKSLASLLISVAVGLPFFIIRK